MAPNFLVRLLNLFGSLRNMLFLVFTFTEVKHIFSLKSKSIIDLHKWVTVCVIAFVVVDTQMEIMLQGVQN